MSDIESLECPCCSKKRYVHCCKPLHEGELAENALALMRSRFSAYALNLPHYIIKTTHPASPQYGSDRKKWLRSLSQFCQHTEFKKLEVLNFQEHGDFSVVTFVAHLTQDGQDASFTERSYFDKFKGRWLYRSGELMEGHAPNLVTNEQIKLLPLAYYGDPILEKVASEVTVIDDALKQLIESMVETMDASHGIGIAAPQVHHSIRLFIIRTPEELGKGKVDFKEVKVFINPEVISPSQETSRMSEGCLSIPTIHADVERPKEVTVVYTNLEGERVTERVSGWQARMIQHEHDHLNGILFFQHLPRAERKRLEPLLAQIKGRIHDGTEL